LNWKLNLNNDMLYGSGFGCILMALIIVGVEQYNGPDPDFNSLESYSGQLVDVKIERNNERVFAELLVEKNQQKAILFQMDIGQIVPVIKQLRPGEVVSALIVNKKYTYHATGLPRYSMWQLTVGTKTVFSYDDLIQFRDKRLTRDYIFAAVSGIVGPICFAIGIGQKLINNQTTK
jgi:hypothetical protein